MAPGSDHTPQDQLSEIHRQYLNDHAVSDEVIAQQGIRSEGGVIVFTWREGEHETEQRRPWPGEAGVYYWTTDADLHLNIIRESETAREPVLLCEGTKQSLAVASWAPPEYAVYGMPGCYGWTMSRKLNLARFAGRQVLIMLDADAADNLDVYEAGARLASELAMEDPPATASFIPSPAWGKDGIDDYLSRIAADRRADRLVKLIAKAQDKPAEKKPTKRKVKEQQPDTGGRPAVIVNRDRLVVISDILTIMRDRWGGRELFNYGGVLTRLRGSRTEPLDKDAFAAWLAEGIYTYKYYPPTAMSPGKSEPDWPDQQTMGAVLSLADRFAVLDRVARVPFFRDDGSACFKNGYDWASGTVLACGNSGMDRLDIPEAPSQEEARAAASFLLDEWLGDMPFRTPASRASALALVLTPFIRGLVPLVPLAVVSGLQPGVGKGLFGDCVSTMITGQTQPPLPYVTDDEDEIRKQLTAAFRQGTDLFCFDEAHILSGASLSRALTSITYTDRILGVTRMAEFPNRVTWMSLGNQVEVNADMSRRVYWIELYPAAPDPENRLAAEFAHPDLREWTAANRPELVTAALTVIRAWYAAGQPAYNRGSLMGSFEKWDRMMSGILAHAGVPGFLEELAEQRRQADTSGGWWADHMAWLYRVFGTESFTAGDVRKKAMALSGQWDAPPGLDEVNRSGYTRELGKAYRRVQQRWFNGLRLVQLGKGHDNVIKWVIQVLTPDTVQDLHPDLGGGDQGGNKGSLPDDPGLRDEDTVADLGFSNNISSLSWEGGNGGIGGITQPSRMRNARAPERDTAHAHVTRERALIARTGGLDDPPVAPDTPQLAIAADLETGAADDLFTYTQRDETGYVRLAGIIGPAGVPAIVSGRDVLPLLDMATEITGHNFLGFDLLALAWHCGADYDRLAPKVRDTELIARQADPPRSRESGSSEDRYGLDAVAERLKLPGKTDDLARLKRLHGGYDMIPLDDPEYRAYLEGDLRATAAVAERLQHDDYTRREHTLAALAGRMTLNGFLVDQPLLAERLAQGQARKREALQLLHDGWGLPLTKTVTRGRGADKHDEERVLDSPIGSDAGRAWLEQMYERYQVPDPPRTQKAQKLAIGADDLKALTADPLCPGELRSMIALMNVVTTTRTVYATARDCLAPDGRVHPVVSMRQASGRWSVTNPGLTVFGKRGGKHIERDIFLPDEGHVLLSFDLSQVDMRGMAWLSQDHAYRAMFAPGRDAHTEIGAQVGLDRQSAKVIAHGWNYGLGRARMIKNGLDPDAVDKFIAGMTERFPVLIQWREMIRRMGEAGEILDNGFGRRMRCDTDRAYTVAPALMGQGSARDIMCTSLLRIPREFWKYLRVMIHDEIVVSVPKADARDIAEIMMAAMQWDRAEDLPILCDMASGRNWGECSAK